MTKTFAKYIIKLIPTIKLLNTELCLFIPKKKLIPILIFLKKHTHAQYKILSDICVVDYPLRSNRFEIIYNFLSLQFNSRLKIKVITKDIIGSPSIISVYKNANWWEREAWDMFGIFFFNHPDLRRLLNDYGFEGHPLRKDFPLSGYIEVRYSETKKRVVYEPTTVSQNYRFFKFRNFWK